MTMYIQMDLRMSISRLKTALLSIKNDVNLALARGDATAVVLLDQLTGFDTTDHGTLQDCLSSWFGVGSVVLEFFQVLPL